MAQDANATSLPALPAITSSSNNSASTYDGTVSTVKNEGSSPTNSSSVSSLPNTLAAAIPLAQLLSKPGALNALTSLSALGGLTDLLGGLATLTGPPVQTTGAHRAKPLVNTRGSGTRGGSGNTPFDNQSNVKKFTERNKFNPY